MPSLFETLSSPRVLHRIEDHIYIIQLCDERNLNSLTFDDFLYIAVLLNEANNNNDIFFTVFQSTGKFFSSGGKFDSVLELSPEKIKEEGNNLSYFKKLFGTVLAPNVYVTNAFVNHNKPIICCLNGPAIGLSASIVCLCDIVYSINDSVYLLFPFSSLGFVAEVGSSVTLYDKLGMNATNEHLFFSTKIQFKELINKIIVKDYNLKDNSNFKQLTEEFNKQVITDLKKKYKHLHLNSLIEMKKLLNHEPKRRLIVAQSLETNGTLPFWVEGEPFRRFRELQSGKRRHKL